MTAERRTPNAGWTDRREGGNSGLDSERNKVTNTHVLDALVKISIYLFIYQSSQTIQLSFYADINHIHQVTNTIAILVLFRAY